MISDKANDLINLARETLGADFLLPHFVAIMNNMNQDLNLINPKISALEVADVLIRESNSLVDPESTEEEIYVQFQAVVKTFGNILKVHSSQPGIV